MQLQLNSKYVHYYYVITYYIQIHTESASYFSVELNPTDKRGKAGSAETQKLV